MAIKKVTVQYVPDYTYAQLLTTDRHAFVADEATAGGGDDLGPSPYELLLWSLGSCTAITLLMYARRNGWDLTEVSVHLTHDRVHADDGAHPDSSTARIEEIHTDISLRGQLSQEQRRRLLEIAGRCPVHKTLQNPPRIIDTLIAGE